MTTTPAGYHPEKVAPAGILHGWHASRSFTTPCLSEFSRYIFCACMLLIAAGCLVGSQDCTLDRPRNVGTEPRTSLYHTRFQPFLKMAFFTGVSAYHGIFEDHIATICPQAKRPKLTA